MVNRIVEKYLDQDEQILHANFKKIDTIRKIMPAIGILGVIYLIYTFAFNNYTKSYISNIQGPLKYVYIAVPIIFVVALVFNITNQSKNQIFITNKSVIVTTMFAHQKIYFKDIQSIQVQYTEYFGGARALMKNLLNARYYVQIQGKENGQQIMYNGGTGMSKQYAEILAQTIKEENKKNIII